MLVSGMMILKERIILSITYIAGMVIPLLGITVIGFLSGRNVESESDFTVAGRKASSVLIAGMILGTAIGGGATIGTAQLAYEFGLSGICFSFGGGLAFIIMALFLVEPLRNSEVETGPQLLVKVFGPEAGSLSSLFLSIGTLLSIGANILAAVALLTSVFGLSSWLAAGLIGVLVIFQITFGGVWGASVIGVVRTVLLYFASILSSKIAFSSLGGIEGVRAQLDFTSIFHVFERGIINDLSAVFSVVIGYLSTQTYLQAVFMGKDVKASRHGVIISGLLMFPVGIMGTVVGLYMRANYPDINSSWAFPIFVLDHFPPFLAGLILATLLIVIIATIAGLTLGISTTFSQDIYGKLINPEATAEKRLMISRITIVLIVVIGLFFVLMNLKSVIIEWTYLSMTLRGSCMFLPMMAAMFFKKRIDRKAGIVSIILAPLLALLWSILFPEGIDPLYIGLVIGVLILGSNILNSRNDFNLDKEL